MKWKKNEFHGNSILNRKGYFISYNPSCGSSPAAALFNALGPVFGMEDRTGKPETALCEVTKSGEREWRILNGDHRKAYEKCKTLKECIAYYESKKKKLGSTWSTK